jgi:spore coat protein A, manganese oxidase
MTHDDHGPMFTRREVLKLGAAGGTGFFLSTRFGGVAKLFARAAGPLILDPASVPQFVTPLVIPPAMPRTAKLKVPGSKQVDYYEIAVREFRSRSCRQGSARQKCGATARS